MKNRKLLFACFALASSAVAAADFTEFVAVYPYEMNPRRHPDDSRRLVKPPDGSVFAGRTAFTSLRHVKDATYRQDLDRYTVEHRLGDVVWPHVKMLSNRSFREQIDELARRGLFLFDVWGYIPGQGVYSGDDWQETVVSRAQLAYMRETLGERWLGMDNGEQDIRYCGVSPSTHDRFGHYLHFQRYFERLGDHLGHDLTALIGQGNGVHFLRENCYRMIGAETAQALPNAQVFYSMIRGAGKQFGVPWFGNVSVFNRWGWKEYPAGEKTGLRGTPEGGTSLSLVKRLMYSQILYGSLVCGVESGFFDEKTGALSPIGRIQRGAVDWCARHGRQGPMLATVGILTDVWSGWTFPRLNNDAPYRVWGELAYDLGDHFVNGVVGMLYPGYEDASFFQDERGICAPTPYGDIADIVMSDTPGWHLNQYSVIVVGNTISPSRELSDTLRAYVAQGGRMVIARANAKALFGDDLPACDLIGGSDWGVVEEPQCKLPVVTGWGKSEECSRPLPNPHPLTEEARAVLDRTFRSARLFTAKGGERSLSVITTQSRPGEYVVSVMNNSWRECPLEFVSHVGEIRSCEELRIEDDETNDVGYVPFGVRDAELGTDGAKTIAGGSVRIFRVRAESRGVRILPEAKPPANPRGVALRLWSNDPVKEQILSRPTFFRHYDGVMVGARYILSRDIRALEEERGWLDRQGVERLVDMGDVVNLFPDMRFVDNHPVEGARSREMRRDFIAKAKAFGVPTVFLNRHPIRARQAQRARDENAMRENLKSFSEELSKAGIASVMRDEAQLDSNVPVSERNPAVWLVSARQRNVEQRWDSSILRPVASVFGAVARERLAELARRKDVRLVFNALYPDRDGEYEDVVIWENLKKQNSSINE